MMAPLLLLSSSFADTSHVYGITENIGIPMTRAIAVGFVYGFMKG